VVGGVAANHNPDHLQPNLGLLYCSITALER
jgi:hypothetical protein